LLAAAWLGGAPAAWGQPVTLGRPGEEVTVVADRLQHVAGPTNLLIAEGNAELTRGPSRLQADRIELNPDTGEAIAQGRVVFYDGEDRLVADRIDYNVRSGTGVVYAGSAFSAPYHHLTGERMERLGESVYRVEGGVFTTCEDEEPAWTVRVGSATVELDEGIYGFNASFWVRSLPLVPWIPFFAAPIRRERQSGFLFPTLGQGSRKGFFGRVPYYWAIDDSQDATVALEAYSERGLGLSAEYRYVLSERHRGRVEGFVIDETWGSESASDRARFVTDPLTSLETDEIRGYGGARHDWEIAPRLTFRLDANVVSDDFVYREYSDQLRDRARQRAESTAMLSQRWDAWSLVGEALWYEDVTTDLAVELQRAPRIRLGGMPQPVPGMGGLLFQLQASATNFVRDVGTEGPRLDIGPRLSYPIPIAGVLTVTPFLGGRLTYYDQRVTGTRTVENGRATIEETTHETVLRRLVEGGVDVESRASRVFQMDGRGGLAALQHVIEPRVSWLEIDGRDRTDLPQYDAVDAIPRTSLIGYSLTNRVNAKTLAGPGQEATRWELLRLVLSQQVSLLPSDSRPWKDVRGDLIVQPTQSVRARLDAALDVYGGGIQQFNSELSAAYRDITLSGGTRYDDRSDVNYANLTLSARLVRWLRARGSGNWDLREGPFVERRVGVDLLFQCWAVMVEYVGRHQDEDEVRFSVNLLGLGAVGTQAGTGLR
jgi:LPS-assembly protein